MEVKAYDLSLDIDFRGLKYTGRVTATLEGAKSEVAFNTLGLKIHSAKVGAQSLQWKENPSEEEIVLHGVPPGDVQIAFEFDGKVSDGSLVGLYKSRFDGGYILTTQFEATQARRMFPCIDHPAYKAVFNVEVAVQDGEHIIFNTPISHQSVRADGHRVFRFEPTPRMSTYLLYLGIGKFAEAFRTDGRLKVIVAAPEDKKGTTAYALDHGGRTVRFFEEYFGIPYPLPKLHLIAVPDTWVGGMENWGAITFREMALLVDDQASASAKRLVVDVIAHEVAHQWFGDLVTMTWWNDIWLNESFATFMTHKAVDFLHPEWETWNDFLADDVSRALLWDALHSSHPIESKVERPADIDEAFDDITYQKGAAVLRMVESYVGEEEFRRGVSTYLNRFQYANAAGSDLWHAIEEVTGVPVQKIMEGWIKRDGYPVVSLELRGEKLHLRQQRFFLEGAQEATPWPLPVTVRAGTKTHRMLLDGAFGSIEVGANPGLVVGNLGRNGFYRVHYTKELHARLLDHFTELDVKDRWGFVQDAYAGLLSGEHSLDDYLALLARTEQDPSWLVAIEAGMQLGVLLAIAYGNDRVKEAIRKFVVAQLARIGLSPKEGEPNPVRTLRERLANLRTIVDDAFAKEMASKWPSYETVDPDLKASIAIAHGRFGGATEHAELIERFMNAPSELEVLRMSMGLLSFPQVELLERSLNLTFDPRTGIGKGLTLVQAALNMATRTPASRKVTWEWFSKSLEILESVTKGSSLLTLLLQYYIPRGGLGLESEMKAFLEGRTITGGEAGKMKGLELLHVYEGLRRRL